MKIVARNLVAWLGVLVLLVCQSRALADVTEGLIGYWRLDESKGILAADSSASGNNGTLLNFPANEDHWVSGGGQWGDGALDFGSREDARLVVHQQVTISPQKGTISHWLKPVGLMTMVSYYFSDQGAGTYNGYGSLGQPGLEVHTGTWIDNNNNWELFIEHWGDGSQAFTHVHGGNVLPGEWTQVVGTWEAGEQARLYVNGQMVAEELIGSISGNPTFEAMGGCLQDHKGSPTGRAWAGLIDDVRTYDRALSAEEVGELFATEPPPLESSSSPSPANGATDVLQGSVLTWVPGVAAAEHDVYVGSDFDEVSTATDASVVYMGRQNINSFDPGRLVFGKTYYWRVDDITSTGLVSQGAVWSFTIEPVAIELSGTLITAVASSRSSDDEGPENTINGSGLNNGVHSKEPNDMWLSAEDPNGAWIQYVFDKPYKLHDMQLWNHNTAMENLAGFGIREAVIEHSPDGELWTVLGPVELVRGGKTQVPLGDIVAIAVRVTAQRNWGGRFDQYGLSEVQFAYIPTFAREPEPAIDDTGISADVVLRWRAGREAALHDVYIGTDINDLPLVDAVSESSYDTASLDLQVNRKYFWKVVEVNEAEVPGVWEGDVWTFTTQAYLPVDDFESYTDDEGNRIYEIWVDGWGTTDNGSQVGHTEPPFAEQGTVRSGRQSMPLFYDNISDAVDSVATRTFEEPQDWTRRGVTDLTVWHYGRPKWEGSISYDAATQRYTMTGTGYDIWTNVATNRGFDEFHYAFKQLTGDGSITAKIESSTQPHDWTRVGVMIRESLDTDAVNAVAYVTPLGRVGWQWRLVTGSNSESTRSENGAVTLPHWVRLTREGNTITAKHSRDGITWEDMVESANPQEPTSRTIPMGLDIYVGVFVCSHVDHVPATAILSNVSTTGSVTPSGPFTTSQDVGLPEGNDLGQLYAVLADTMGRQATVSHPDGPNAVLVNEWRPFTIPLADIAAQGVDVARISKISIGVGDPSSQVAGGTGILFVDDIWLERSE